MASFGRYLLDRGVLGREQLEEATRVMVVFGGRLGSVLVESGLLTLEEVEEHLARHLDLPCVPRDRAYRPDPRALALAGAELARRHRLIPMWVEKRRLHAALLDPANPERIDQVAFAIGLPVVPYVIAERRLVGLLERHYGIRPDSRFTDLGILELAGHAKPPSRDALEAAPSGPAQAGAEADEFARWRAAHGIQPLAEGEELCEPGEFATLFVDHARPPSLRSAPSARREEAREPRREPRRLTPARSPAEAAQLEAELVMTADRDAVAPTALRLAAFHARVAALFAVHDGMIQGVLAAGDVARERIDGILLAGSAPSMLASAARGRIFHGRPASEGVDATIVRVLGDGEPPDAAVVPIAVEARVVQLLYVDNRPEPLAPRSLAALGALCDAVSAAYARIIAESAARHC